MPNFMKWRTLAAVLFAFALSASAARAADHVWVEMAPGGGSVVRVLTVAAQCPSLSVDGRNTAMPTRAVPATLAERTNKALVQGSIAFPGLVCEAAVPRTALRATIAGRALPLPVRRINRIVVIGDTGCRMKAADHEYQACNIAAKWPFAAVAAQAALKHPDLVLHVGDYHYRENPCDTAAEPDCAAAVWGYGEAAWRADFLDPAAPLLAAAPWVMVRGNHEECARAGQGWWRLLDPHPLLAGRDCNAAAGDFVGNRTEPYRVKLGGGARLIVADLAGLNDAKPDNDAQAQAYRDDFAAIDQLAVGSKDSFVTAHYPLSAVLWNKQGKLEVGSKPLDQFDHLRFPHARAMISGHVHTFQFARTDHHRVQVVAGFSGTLEADAKAPVSLADLRGEAGSDAVKELTTIAGRFGFALLERRAKGWRLTAYAADGTEMGRFAL